MCVCVFEFKINFIPRSYKTIFSKNYLITFLNFQRVNIFIFYEFFSVFQQKPLLIGKKNGTARYFIIEWKNKKKKNVYNFGDFVTVFHFLDPNIDTSSCIVFQWDLCLDHLPSITTCACFKRRTTGVCSDVCVVNKGKNERRSLSNSNYYYLKIIIMDEK